MIDAESNPKFDQKEVEKTRAILKPGRAIRVSIVCYAVEEGQLQKTLASLLEACKLPLRDGLLQSVEIVLVDNGPNDFERIKIESLLAFGKEIAEPEIRLSMLGDGCNRGFGAGHNLAFSSSASDFHLVLNPDVELASDALTAAIKFMNANDDCAIITPAIYAGDGKRQYLCKRYPSVLDLLIRGFAPVFVRRLFARRLMSYEMRDVISESVVWSPPIISGCFMLFRSSLLEKIQGFDPKYFLYFEDFDLSLRASQVARIAYVPTVKIVHHGGHAARKGLRHIYLFIRSAITFFHSHGWRWY